jgi:hypothetical protein
MIIQTKSHQPKVSKYHQTSTTVEDWTRPCALATATTDSLVISKESALCASSRGHLHLSFPEPISRVLDQSEVSHQA